MQTVTVIKNKTIGGMSISSSYTVQNDGIISQNATIPMAEAGTLSTRTGDAVGVVTLTEAGDMPASGIGDLYSDEGNVYQCVYTRTSTAVSIASVGSGTLPTELSSVVFCDTIQIDAAFSGSSMVFMSSIQNKAGHVAFCITGGASQLDVDLVADKDFGWDETETSVTNPLIGDAITHILVSTSDVVTDAIFKSGILYDSAG